MSDDSRIAVSSSLMVMRKPLELLEKLAAFIPRRRTNLVALSRRARPAFQLAGTRGGPRRPAGGSAGGARAASEADDEPTTAPVARYWAWADLMRRSFDVDVLACPRCGGRLRWIATIED
jgi:hypothetical protein